MTNLPAHKRKNPPPAKTKRETIPQSNSSGGGIASTLIDGITFGAGSSIGHSIINKYLDCFHLKIAIKKMIVQKYCIILMNVRKIAEMLKNHGIMMLVWIFF